MSTSPAADNTNTGRWAASSKLKRQRKRKLEQSLVPGWGTYDLNFNTFNNPGAESLRSFIRKLDQTARWANTRSQYTENARVESPRSALDFITALYEDPSKVVEDVITIDGDEDLTRRLKMQFSRPLLFQSTTTRSISHPKVSWDKFWAFMRTNRQKWVDVYDYSIDEEVKRTEKRLVENVIKHWEKDSRTALNCLDIENRIGECCPTPIMESDLIQRIAIDSQTTIGKTDSTWDNPHNEFLLLSTRDCISPIHVDIGAALTWLYVLHGRKIVYFPSTINLNAVRLLAQLGSEQFNGYDGGWIRVELRPGDLFIMPPSCPHAVFTPDDSLVVGGHFYTSAHLPSTLEGLSLLEEKQGISNESLEDSHYMTLAQILDSYDTVATPEEVKRAWATCYLFLDSPTKPQLPESRTIFINSLKDFNKRAAESFSQEPE
ncbi:hypothetical protein AARAC_011560 [Aspergillus arachidicola]|uniref:[histone H3]-dimethyl-L-lysine(36) demethylase n=2 Tax=Aspergillus arachidicola TaxID=656916 RepID=A0A2G7FMG4_9EURO|nr:hypothetical protein AARAC_011560 [Aspergillus arachidicola]